MKLGKKTQCKNSLTLVQETTFSYDSKITYKMRLSPPRMLLCGKAENQHREETACGMGETRANPTSNKRISIKNMSETHATQQQNCSNNNNMLRN